MKIKIKYKDNTIERIKKIPTGDWLDLRASEDITMLKDEFKLIPLGVAMQLPLGYEAHIAPRGSTFKNFGIIQTNHVGVVDNSFNGDNDWWFMASYALRDTFIEKGSRICQFRIIEKQPELDFEEVESLGNQDRGMFGSTGIK